MIVLQMIFGVVMVGGLVAMLVLPIIAIVRTRRIADLRERVEQLEYEVGRLRRAASPPDEVVLVERPAAVAQAPLDVIPVSAPPAQERRRLPAVRETDAATLESWVGQKALGWAAVVLLLFATAFFLKYAFDNDWIGELGRVSMGIVAGAVLCVAGLVMHRRKRPLTSQMLSAAGVALLYLTTFSAFGYYHLMTRDRAAIFLIVVVVEAAALAILYNAPAIAVMAVVGGLLSPVLLRSDHDRYLSLFAYLAALNAGVVGLALFRRWLFLAPIALLGTQALYWSWHFERYHPEKLDAALAFQGVIFALFLIHDLIDPVVRRLRRHPIQIVQLLVNAFFFSLAGYVLLQEDYRLWLPVAAIGLAVVYAALGWFIQHRLPEDAWLQLSAAAAGFSFIAVAVALRGEAAWISLGWAVEGAALWWFGLRIPPSRCAGSGLPCCCWRSAGWSRWTLPGSVEGLSRLSSTATPCLPWPSPLASWRRRGRPAVCRALRMHRAISPVQQSSWGAPPGGCSPWAA